MNRAEELYEAYCCAVGGVAHDGNQLPSWIAFSADPAKAKQVAGWEAVAAASMSDGYHTFDELYEHRHALFLMLMRSYPTLSWISMTHNDGTYLDGWFIAGINAPTGDITYHLPERLWAAARETGALTVECAPRWDGHTAAAVVDRLMAWAKIAGRGDVASKLAGALQDCVAVFECDLRGLSLIQPELKQAKEALALLGDERVADPRDIEIRRLRDEVHELGLQNTALDRSLCAVLKERGKQGGAS